MTALTPAQSLEVLDFETVLQAQKNWLTERDATLVEVLNIESETIVKLLENFAYRELHLRARINDGIKATMISTADGSDLDNLLQLFGVERLTILIADDTTTPPTPAVMENDEHYRKRGLLVFESFSTAGPKLGYIYHGFSVTGVHDIYASSPRNGAVDIVIMSANGIADEALLVAVSAKLNDEKIRPLGTQLAVASAIQVDYSITATLELDSTPEASLAIANAHTAIEEYIEARFRIGKDIHLSSIYATLQQNGVESVNLITPVNNVLIDNTQFANCTSISIT